MINNEVKSHILGLPMHKLCKELIGCPLCWWRRLVNAYRVKAWCG